jgi:hypothetical protein
MFQSSVPDLGAARRMLWTAVAVSLTVAVVLVVIFAPRLTRTYGDTDDAMRLVLVRDLVHGRGWYDQGVARLQPPLGSYMHWSRLIDGGVAGLIMLLRPVLGAAGAEIGARLLWPLLWIAPTVMAALILARRLGGGLAVLPAAVLLAVGLPLYLQFAPGRVDHHNVQIALCLVAAALAAQSRGDGAGVRSAALAGAASALGLAVGLEALPFCAVIAAGLALRFVLRAEGRRPAIAFGLSLAASAALVFTVQTPPWRWGLAVCDAMGLNLVLGLVVGGLGLAGAALACGSAKAPVRAAAAGTAGALALIAYLALDPNCLRGPMAEIDPRLFPIWLNHVQELMPWPQLIDASREHFVLDVLTAMLGLATWVWMLRRPARRTDFAWLLSGALLLLATAMDAMAGRMESYLLWFAVPVVAAALTALSEARLNRALVPTVALALAVSPAPMDAAADALFTNKTANAAADVQPDHCFDTAAYARLAGLPPGLALSETDLGPFILAHTADSVLTAPYHRMSWGILAAHDALSAEPAAARGKVHALHVAYVVACPAHSGWFSHVSKPPLSLLRGLDRDASPAWLEPLSAPGAALRVYRVR